MKERINNPEPLESSTEIGEANKLEKFAAEKVKAIETKRAQMASQIDEYLQDEGLPENDKQELRSIKEKVLSAAKSIKDAMFYYSRIVVFGGLLLDMSFKTSPHLPQEPFKNKVARAKAEMQKEGITSEQRLAYTPLFNDLIYKIKTPYGYLNSMENFDELWKSTTGERGEVANGREDAWRLYLGLPQRDHTFGVSEYQPKRSKDKDQYYYKIPGYFKKITNDYNPTTIEYMSKRKDFDYKDGFLRADMNIMGFYTVSFGKDEKGSYISYYDKWDLKVPPEFESGFFGKPFEIYDRLYYDPITFEVLSPKEEPTNPDILGGPGDDTM